MPLTILLLELPILFIHKCSQTFFYCTNQIFLCDSRIFLSHADRLELCGLLPLVVKYSRLPFLDW